MVKGITYILKNDAVVQGLIGENTSGEKYKVYPVVCPQPEVAPYIVVKATGRVPIYCKDGVSTWTYSYDVYAYHYNYDSSAEIAEAVEAALDIQEETTVNGVTFDEIRYINRVDGYNDAHSLFVHISSFEAQVNEGA